MIPKKIHYCWFGNKEKPAMIKQCIESWKILGWEIYACVRKDYVLSVNP